MSLICFTFSVIMNTNPNIHTGQKLVHIGQKHFRRHKHFVEKVALTPKINTTFFIANLMLNIFTLNNFFRKSVFSEGTARWNFWLAECDTIPLQTRYLMFQTRLCAKWWLDFVIYAWRNYLLNNLRIKVVTDM